MALDVLQQFLTLRLLNIGADDARLGFIREASADLAKGLQEAPPRAIGFSLASLAPHVDAAHPAMTAAAQAIEARWNTYRGAFDDTPISLFRAMTGEALAQAAAKDVRIAASLAYLARNRLPQINLGAEGPIWRELIGEVDAKVEAAAQEAWTSASFAAPKLSSKAPDFELTISKTKVDAARLKAGLGAAAGPHDEGGTTFPNSPNPYFPNSASEWSHQFAPRAAAAIAAAVDQVAVSAQGDLYAPMKALSENVSAFGTALAKAAKASAEGLRRRTGLLWWKEALYSPSAKCSYREIAPAAAAVRMASDLFDEVPVYHPTSVEYFLRETVRSLSELPDKPQRIEAWVQAIRLDARTEDIHALADGLGVTGEGDLLIGALGGAALTPALAAVELDAPDLAVWMLRELQALHATRSRS
jgi:hypothetical protein